MQKLIIAISVGFFLSVSAILPVFAQEVAQVLGTVERIEGDRFVVKWNDKAALAVKLSDDAADMTAEQKTVVTNAKSFLEYQYVEIKDLAKQFLVVIAGFLTLSVTFSEKIVDIATASWFTKLLLVIVWFSCFGAFALGGIAIFLIYNAGLLAKYAVVHHVAAQYTFIDLINRLMDLLHARIDPPTYQELTFSTQWALVIGGSAFGGALFLLAWIGAIRVLSKKAHAEPSLNS